MTEDRPSEKNRRLVLAGAAAVVVVVAVVATLVVTSGGEDRPVPRGALPTLGHQFGGPPEQSAPAPSDPAEPATLPGYSGKPLWSFPVPAEVEDAASVELAVSDHGYVIQERDEVLALDRAGEQAWRWTPPKVDYFTVRVTGPLVFVSYGHPEDDRWPQPEVIIALDAATGREVWREDEASFWSATTDTIYLSVCYGGQNDRIGDCRFSARDPRTNAVRWSIPTYASSQVVNEPTGVQALPTPHHLLIASYPTGADSLVISSHDPDTGATLGQGYRDDDGSVGSVADATARTVVTYDENDDNPANGCRATLTGFAVSGAGRTWRHTARTAKEDDGRRCARLPFSVNGSRLGVTAEDGRPGVLNVDTGAVEWSAPAEGEAVAASDTMLFVVVDRELLAYRKGTAEPAWRAPFPGSADTANVTITRTAALFTGYGGDQYGYDLRSGKAWSYGPGLAQETPTWFAVCDAGTCRGYPIG